MRRGTSSLDRMGLRSEVNEHVSPAAPGEFAVPRIGPIAVWPPVVLAPMAGVTNAPFRSLCREFGAGLYVSEMITARGLVAVSYTHLRAPETEADLVCRLLRVK